MRAAVYARVSTVDQEPENQLQELRRYVQARGWTIAEYVDRGVSGAKDRRPALDELITDARRRRFDVLVCWRLDRLGRNLKHLITLLDELQALGVAFVSLGEGIDATTPAGTLQLHILGAIAEFAAPRQVDKVVYGEDVGTIRALEEDGSLAYVVDPDAGGPAAEFEFDDPDFNFRSLRGNLVFRWEYLPGSTLFFVWTQDRNAVESIGDFALGRDVGRMFDAPADNVFLVKATYWLEF